MSTEDLRRMSRLAMMGDALAKLLEADQPPHGIVECRRKEMEIDVPIFRFHRDEKNHTAPRSPVKSFKKSSKR